jgi:hypothetical protein
MKVNEALAGALPPPSSPRKKTLVGRAAVAPPLRLPEAHHLALFET